MKQALRKSRITILIPDSFLENEDTLLLKTKKIGRLVRTVSIFRIAKVYFYRDNGTESDRQIIKEISNFLEIPPFLRKYVQISSNLKYSAILSPVHSPNHFGIEYNNVIYTTGIIVSNNSGKLSINTGKRKIIEIQQTGTHKPGDFIILKKRDNTYEVCESVPNSVYWNTKFIIGKSSLMKYLHDHSRHYIIAASKAGEPITQNILNSLKNENPFEPILILGPIKGSLKKYIQDPNIADLWLNVIPNQGTKTVKIEEALHSALTLLNLCLFDFK
jgi:predicted SPOUT superfamily RNA methylase MTH1